MKFNHSILSLCLNCASYDELSTTIYSNPSSNFNCFQLYFEASASNFVNYGFFTVNYFVLLACSHGKALSQPTFWPPRSGWPSPIRGTSNSNRGHKGPAMDSCTDIVRAQQLLQLLNMIEVLSEVTRQRRRTWPPYQTGIKQFQMDRMRNRRSWPIEAAVLLQLLMLLLLRLLQMLLLCMHAMNVIGCNFSESRTKWPNREDRCRSERQCCRRTGRGSDVAATFHWSRWLKF